MIFWYFALTLFFTSFVQHSSSRECLECTNHEDNIRRALSMAEKLYSAATKSVHPPVIYRKAAQPLPVVKNKTIVSKLPNGTETTTESSTQNSTNVTQEVTDSDNQLSVKLESEVNRLMRKDRKLFNELTGKKRQLNEEKVERRFFSLDENSNPEPANNRRFVWSFLNWMKRKLNALKTRILGFVRKKKPGSSSSGAPANTPAAEAPAEPDETRKFGEWKEEWKEYASNVLHNKINWKKWNVFEQFLIDKGIMFKRSMATPANLEDPTTFDPGNKRKNEAPSINTRRVANQASVEAALITIEETERVLSTFNQSDPTLSKNDIAMAAAKIVAAVTRRCLNQAVQELVNAANSQELFNALKLINAAAATAASTTVEQAKLVLEKLFHKNKGGISPETRRALNEVVATAGAVAGEKTRRTAGKVAIELASLKLQQEAETHSRRRLTTHYLPNGYTLYEPVRRNQLGQEKTQTDKPQCDTSGGTTTPAPPGGGKTRKTMAELSVDLKPGNLAYNTEYHQGIKYLSPYLRRKHFGMKRPNLEKFKIAAEDQHSGYRTKGKPNYLMPHPLTFSQNMNNNAYNVDHEIPKVPSTERTKSKTQIFSVDVKLTGKIWDDDEDAPPEENNNQHVQNQNWHKYNRS